MSSKHRILAINLTEVEAESMVAGLRHVGISAVCEEHINWHAVSLSHRAPQEIRHMALMFVTGWLCSNKSVDGLRTYLPEA